MWIAKYYEYYREDTEPGPYGSCGYHNLEYTTTHSTYLGAFWASCVWMFKGIGRRTPILEWVKHPLLPEAKAYK